MPEFNRTRSMLLSALLMVPTALTQTAVAQTAQAQTAQAQGTATAPGADLSGVKSYLTGKLSEQLAGARQQQQGADRYFALARAVNFNYRQLASGGSAAAVRAALQQARAGWSVASPVYEEIEGIVAGVGVLSKFDLILDAGTSGAAGGDSVAPIDLTLDGGRVVRRPGNLFGVNETSLWGTNRAFSSNVAFDVDGDGRVSYGDTLPDAKLLKAASDAEAQQTALLLRAARAWQPSQADVFGALVANVPTVGPTFFDDWKNSRFVLGKSARRSDFGVISRLSDLNGNIASWTVMYRGLAPLVRAKNPALDAQLMQGLSGLNSYVRMLVARERQRSFTPEQADTLQEEAQNRATAITGRLTQAAALLNVKVSQ